MYKTIYFAGGCFWGVEKYFSCIEGVVETEAGYANGDTENPTYEEVCERHTGHAEAVRVVYESEKVRLERLLDLFYQIIDPTSIDRQGNDRGPQYRTGIYYSDEADRPIIIQSLVRLQRLYEKPLAVEAEPLRLFCPAEEYHQKYLDKNPSGYCHIGRDRFEAARNANRRYHSKSQEELARTLTKMQYEVTQNRGTEPPYRNQYWNQFQEGIYVDITTGEPLFLSTDKFDSGCGWPSFAKPIASSSLTEIQDESHGMERTEVRSRLGDSHLGHVFSDGPIERGGLRYCINSSSLRFVPKDKMAAEGYQEYLPLLENQAAPQRSDQRKTADCTECEIT